MGPIGRAILARAEVVSSWLAYTSRRPDPEVPHRFVPDLETLARQSHVLITADQEDGKLKDAINAKILDRLGPGGIDVDSTRLSETVDYDALASALAEGRTAAAGIYVHAPPLRHRARRPADAVLLDAADAVAARTSALMGFEKPSARVIELPKRA